MVVIILRHFLERSRTRCDAGRLGRVSAGHRPSRRETVRCVSKRRTGIKSLKTLWHTKLARLTRARARATRPTKLGGELTSGHLQRPLYPASVHIHSLERGLAACLASCARWFSPEGDVERRMRCIAAFHAWLRSICASQSDRRAITDIKKAYHNHSLSSSARGYAEKSLTFEESLIGGRIV